VASAISSHPPLAYQKAAMLRSAIRKSARDMRLLNR
jgi:hypothetical protein